MPQQVLVVDIETIKDTAILPADWGAGKWPPPIGWRIVAIGLLAASRDRDGVFIVEKITCGTGEERTLLKQFWSFFSRRLPSVITWNGRCFDLPVLLHRAMLHKISAVGWFSHKRSTNYGYRYSADGHCDLMDQLTDYGAVNKMPMELFATAMGFAGKQGVDGSQVEKLYAENRLEELASYCESDVMSLYGVYLRWLHLTGQLDDAMLKRSMGGFAEFVMASRSMKPCAANFYEKSSELFVEDQTSGKLLPRA